MQSNILVTRWRSLLFLAHLCWMREWGKRLAQCVAAHSEHAQGNRADYSTKGLERAGAHSRRYTLEINVACSWIFVVWYGGAAHPSGFFGELRSGLRQRHPRDKHKPREALMVWVEGSRNLFIKNTQNCSIWIRRGALSLSLSLCPIPHAPLSFPPSLSLFLSPSIERVLSPSLSLSLSTDRRKPGGK